MGASPVDAHAPVSPAVERADTGERRERRGGAARPPRRPRRAVEPQNESLDESIEDDLPPPPRGRLDVVA